MEKDITIDELEDFTCHCKSKTFFVAQRLKILPAVYSSTGQPGFLTSNPIFICVGCQKEINTQEEIDKMKKPITLVKRGEPDGTSN